jgi:peptide/nickel transport system substrate-binding protein
MDPYNSPDELTGGGLHKLIYETLVWVEIDSAGQLQYRPLLATSWRKLQPTLWEVKVREGVQFHDGSPF